MSIGDAFRWEAPPDACWVWGQCYRLEDQMRPLLDAIGYYADGLRTEWRLSLDDLTAVRQSTSLLPSQGFVGRRTRLSPVDGDSGPGNPKTFERFRRALCHIEPENLPPELLGGLSSSEALR